MSLENDSSNKAAPVEAPQRQSEVATTTATEASNRTATEAYQEMDRRSLTTPGYAGDDASRTGVGVGTDTGVDAFGRAKTTLDSVGVTDDTSQQTGDKGPLTRRVGRDGVNHLAPEARDKGVTFMNASDGNDFQATYDPNQRRDRRASLEQGEVNGGMKKTMTFEGRQDGLARQETFEKGSTYEGAKRFEPGKGHNGLLTETVAGDSATGEVTRNRTFESGRNPEKISQEKVQVRNGVTTTDRQYEGRADGMISDSTVVDKNGTTRTQQFPDGSIKTVTGADGKPVVTAYDTEGNELKDGLPSQQKRTGDQQQGTGDQQQGTGDQQQGTGDQQQRRQQGDQQQGTGEQQPEGEKDPKKKAIDDQLKKFEADLNARNELPPLRKGEGPYQALQRAVKEGKIPPMKPDEMLKEARRIRDRDLQGDKKHYKQGEKLKVNSPEEIKQKVDAERKRLEGGSGQQQGTGDQRQQGQGDQRQQGQGDQRQQGQGDQRRQQGEGERQQTDEERRIAEERRRQGQERRERREGVAPEPPPEGGEGAGERGREGGRERTEAEPAPDSPEGRLKASRERLDRAAEEQIKSPEDRKRFQENMRKFEERAKKEGMSPEEVTKTYDSVTRMMTAPQGDAKLPNAEQRALLAQNFMHHAADPKNIDQGSANTCNVTTMQERLMTRTPSKMADMLEQASTKGQYTAPDGKVIKLDPRAMQPISGLDSPTPADNTRSYTTQVLNHTMVNEMSQRRNPPEYYTQLTGGVDENGQRLRQNDSGERLRAGSFDGTNITDSKGGSQPKASIYDMNQAMQRYTGEKGTIAVEGNTFGADPEARNMTTFKNPQELAAEIQKAQREGRLPLIIMVDGNHPSMYGRPGQSREWGAHVVSIRGYDPATGQVEISNQWGKGNDRNIDINTLYQATKPPEKEIKGGEGQQQRQQRESEEQRQRNQGGQERSFRGFQQTGSDMVDIYHEQKLRELYIPRDK